MVDIHGFCKGLSEGSPLQKPWISLQSSKSNLTLIKFEPLYTAAYVTTVIQPREYFESTKCTYMYESSKCNVMQIGYTPQILKQI